MTTHYYPTFMELEVTDEARQLITELIDPDDCWYDHNNLCQAHGLAERPCPHERAKKYLAQPDRDHCSPEEREVIDKVLTWYADDSLFRRETIVPLTEALDILLEARAKGEKK